jgi:hypothetical protein
MPTTPAARPQVLLDLLSQIGDWEPFLGPTGAFLWRVPASKGGTYTVAATSCTCPADQYGKGNPCKHRQTLALYRQIVLGYLAHVRAYRRIAAERYPKQETA